MALPPPPPPFPAKTLRFLVPSPCPHPAWLKPHTSGLGNTTSKPGEPVPSEQPWKLSSLRGVPRFPGNRLASMAYWQSHVSAPRRPHPRVLVSPLGHSAWKTAGHAESREVGESVDTRGERAGKRANPEATCRSGFLPTRLLHWYPPRPMAAGWLTLFALFAPFPASASDRHDIEG